MIDSVPPAEPMFFGEEGAVQFGWLHRAREPRSGLVLVACSPFGFEEVCSHRSIRYVAEAAAAAGFDAFRFDYCGTGDAQDGKFGPTMGTWRASVHAAIDTARRATAATRVALFGVRLGALLAAVAGSQRDDVEGLVAFAPMSQGRDWLREAVLLGASSSKEKVEAQSSSEVPLPTGVALESAGFLIDEQTAHEIHSYDLRRLDRAPAPQLVIVERDDFDTGSAAWAQALAASGASVLIESWPGYARMMRDPQRAEVPKVVIEGVVQALRRWGVHVPHSPTAARPSPQEWGRDRWQSIGKEGFEERVVSVDSGNVKLFGILTSPLPRRGQDLPKSQHAVLMLNAGTVHHIGPNRLWVQLARRWAARGVCVLRLDVSGIGESPPHATAAENVVYSRHAVSDVLSGLAALRALTGVGHCHALGLCSGAYHALKASVAGAPFLSCVLVNPLTFFWEEGAELTDVKDYSLITLTHRYRRQVWDPRSWSKMIRGDIDWRFVFKVLWRRWRYLAVVGLRGVARALRVPLRQDLLLELQSVAARGCRLHFVFSTGAPGFELLRHHCGSGLAGLKAAGHVEVDFVPNADHTFTQYGPRAALIGVLDRHFSAFWRG